MFKRIKKRAKEDRGNSVIILGIMLLMALMMVGALLLDVTKAHQLKSSYVDAARKATQAAVMEQRADGTLKPESIAAAVHWYENVIRPTIINKDSSFAKCEDHEAKFYVTMTNEADTDRSTIGPITRSQLNGTNSVEDVASRIVAIDNNSLRKATRNQNYTTIQLEVEEATTNVIMPAAFAIGQAKDGENDKHLNCQRMEIGAKATIFKGSNTGSYE